jgi:hypothetical protein
MEAEAVLLAELGSGRADETVAVSVEVPVVVAAPFRVTVAVAPAAIELM